MPVAVGDAILVRAGEIIPVDGVITSAGAVLDEAALTGEPIPVHRRKGEAARSGTLNAGETFEMRASATAGESTYAGIVRLVTAAQTAKAPFIRLADRYALLLLPVTLLVAGAAWLLSGDSVRGLAVLVAATPCPLILAAPVAFIAGVSQAARKGILIKGGGPLEALARTHTVMFDKTGTLTVGGARLIAIEAAPGESAGRGAAAGRIAGAGLASRRGGRDRRGRAGQRASSWSCPRTSTKPWGPASRAGSEAARSASGRTSWSTAPASPRNGPCACCGAPPGARR